MARYFVRDLIDKYKQLWKKLGRKPTLKDVLSEHRKNPNTFPSPSTYSYQCHGIEKVAKSQKKN
jgi:hypothetical protein